MKTTEETEEAERAVVTCSELSEAYARAELTAAFPSLPAPVRLDEGVFLLEPGVNFADFAARLDALPSVFIRHSLPVQAQIGLTAAEGDVSLLLDAARGLFSRLQAGQTFAVQSRILGDGPLPYRKFTLNNTLSDTIESEIGLPLDCKMPGQIVSLLCTPTTGYLGVSQASDNRSLWPGGNHRFRKEDEQISRAEFKLLEALSVWDLSLPPAGNALDLGAAPGGWTRVLLQHGLNVTAIDPADMDGRLRLEFGPRLKHARMWIQDYLPCRQRFDVLVNDLRMDALDSVEIMLHARDCLKTDGLAIVTLKLPETPDAKLGNLRLVELATQRLTRSYRLLGARQLYHNRSEVTVALRAK